MDFHDVIKSRRSIRDYKPDAIPAEAVERIRKAVVEAPTACNLQPFKTLFITNPKLREAVCSVYTRDWLKTAPAIAVVLSNPQTAWKRLEGDSIADIDAAIVMENLVLAAAAEGLGTCWICAYRRAELDAVLGVEAPWRSFAMTPVGYPAETPRPAFRKPSGELFKVIS